MKNIHFCPKGPAIYKTLQQIFDKAPDKARVKGFEIQSVLFMNGS